MFGDVNKRANEIVNDMVRLDIKNEDFGLIEEEIAATKELLGELWRVSQTKELLLGQKSRIKWVQAGDQNTKFFHSCINWQWRTNSLSGLLVEGRWEDKPIKVKRK